MSLCLPAAAPQAGAPGPCTCVLSQPAGKGSPSLRCGLLRTRAGARVGSRLPGQMVPADGVTQAPAKGPVGSRAPTTLCFPLLTSKRHRKGHIHSQLIDDTLSTRV